MSRCSTRTAPAVAALLAVTGGCVSEGDWTTSPSTRATLVPAGPTSNARGYAAGILPVGAVPYDNRSLPLVHARGEMAATQVGDAPEWETLLAVEGAPLPDRTHVEVWSVDRDLGRASRSWASEPSLILGRAADEQRFLVESVRPDGARWIGAARWSGGPIEWLVADESTNAFATLDHDGRLAWSRRTRQAEHFDLVVRDGADEWTLGAQGGDWLLPTWSARPHGLFALRLLDGELQAVYLDAAGPEIAADSLVRVVIAADMNRYAAYQSLASMAQTAAAPDAGANPELLFWHPTAARMGLWQPLVSPAGTTLLESGSIAAVRDPRGHLLVSTAAHLSLQSAIDQQDHRPLIPGTYVPRRVDIDDWPYVLLGPSPDRISLVAFKLLPQ